MNPKFMALYIVAGTLSLLLVIYKLVTNSTILNNTGIALNIVMCLVFYYLAYKTYHEKKDKELM